MSDIADGWATDGFFFTEAARGGPLTWVPGGSKFEEDALGPVRHAHDDAAEYFYIAAGAIRVEAGGEEFVLTEGDLMCIPPEVPHNVLGIESDIEARVFCIVGPNHVDNKWRTSDFRTIDGSAAVTVSRPFEQDQISGSGVLSCTALTIINGTAEIVRASDDRESVYFPLDPGLTITLENGLRGSLRRHAFLHVRAGSRHLLSTASGRCRALRFDAAFEMWAGVPLE